MNYITSSSKDLPLYLAYMRTTASSSLNGNATSNIDFDTFSNLMKDDNIVDKSLSRKMPDNKYLINYSFPQDIETQTNVKNIISKAYEKGIIDKNDNLINFNKYNHYFEKNTNSNSSLDVNI